MIWILVGVLVTGVAALVVTSVITGVKRAEYQKMYTAAANTLRQDYLNYALNNQVDGNQIPMPGSSKMMLCLKTGGGRNKHRFVFDPDKRIMIGRDAEHSNVYINDSTVSRDHCCIFSEGGQIYLQDLNSANGVMLKRGLFYRVQLREGYRMALRSGDLIGIGKSQFKVILFYFDMALI